MNSKKNTKKFSLIIPIVLGIIFFMYNLFFFNDLKYDFSSVQKNMEFCEGEVCLEAVSNARTVEDFLGEQKISLSSEDLIFPKKEEKIYSGTIIKFLRAKKITVKEGGNTHELYTTGKTVEEAIWGSKINFSDDDISKPDRKSFVEDGMKIAITHVEIKEETRQEDVDYKTISNEDDELGWRIKKVTQKGIKGINEVKYRVVYYDGKEISKKVLEKNRTKDPTDEIVTQGTYMKLGKERTGQGTWYAYKGGMFAASTTIPKGSYAKVTNTDNDKTVVVQINDYGPQGKGRIIDLDKVAFEELASLGAGVINVKVEQVLN